MKTKFEYQQEISEMLNQISPTGRKAIEAEFIYAQSVRDNDWAAAWEFVYGWLHGSAKNKSGMRRVNKIVRENRKPQ